MGCCEVTNPPDRTVLVALVAVGFDLGAGAGAGVGRAALLGAVLELRVGTVTIPDRSTSLTALLPLLDWAVIISRTARGALPLDLASAVRGALSDESEFSVGRMAIGFPVDSDVALDRGLKLVGLLEIATGPEEPDPAEDRVIFLAPTALEVRPPKMLFSAVAIGIGFET